MKKLYNRLKQLLFPPRCIICRDYLQPDTSILFCSECLRHLPFVPKEHCPVCGKVTPSGSSLCFDCHNNRPAFRCHQSVLFYTKEIRQALLLFKFSHKRHYAIPIGTLMSNYITQDYDLITAVPITRKRCRERGYNQSQLLAEQIERLRGIPYADTLKKIKNTPPQSKLNFRKTQENIKNAFCAVQPNLLPGKRILLIDDICTTGATLNECAKVLIKEGAAYVDALTFAMTDRRIKQIKGTKKNETITDFETSPF